MRVEIPKDFESNADKFSDGHLKIRDFLVSNLSEDWQIYNKPSLNGLFPDFVLINEWKGIQIIRILENVNDQVGKLELLKIKDEVLGFLKMKASEINITCCLASLNKSSEKIVYEDLSIEGNWVHFLKKQTDYSVFGKELIEDNLSDESKRDYLGYAFPLTGSNYDFEFKDSSYNKLKAWLRPNDFTEELYEVFALDRQQRDIATRPAPSGTGMRKIKGGSGTGKTLTLAAKAAHLILIQKKKKVLMMNFTRTTRTLSRYSFRRAFLSGTAENIGRKQQGFLFDNLDDMNFIEPVYLHFHGMIDRLKSLKFINNGIIKKEIPSGVIKLGKDLNKYMEANNLSFPESFLFDAVLVDEGQLFEGEWWKLTKKLVKPGGEAYIAADFTQDGKGINAHRWIDDPEGLGIPGRWNELKESYRLPQSYIPYMKIYLDTFLKNVKTDDHLDPLDDEIIYPQEADEPYEEEQCNMKWINIENESPAVFCASIIEDYLPDNVKDFSYPDLTFLSCTNQRGWEVVIELINRKINVLDTYPYSVMKFKEEKGKKIYIADDTLRKQKRTEDWELTKDKVKASTLHSFQGFETSCLVFLIEPKRKSQSWRNYFKDIYVGLTRVKSNSQNFKSEIHVINMEPELNTYGETWPG